MALIVSEKLANYLNINAKLRWTLAQLLKCFEKKCGLGFQRYAINVNDYNILTNTNRKKIKTFTQNDILQIIKSNTKDELCTNYMTCNNNLNKIKIKCLTVYV